MRSGKLASKLGVAVLTAATLISNVGTITTMAATNEQTIGIKGTVKAVSTLDVTVPVQPLEFTIDTDGVFSSTAKKITNHTEVPVYTYVTEVYGTSGDYPSIVNSSAYGDWSSIEHTATIERMALQLNSNELSDVYKTSSSDKSNSNSYVKLGKVDAFNGDLELQLTGNYGRAWYNAEDIVFTYTANMLFTTIEDNFGTGSAYTGTITADISENYSDNAAIAEAAGYTTLTHGTNFTSKTVGNTPDDETITIQYIGWKDNTDGTADIYVKYDSTCDTCAYTFGPGSSSYNTIADGKLKLAGTDLEVSFTISSDILQTLVDDGGLNISINPQGSSVGSLNAAARFFINKATISDISSGVTGA